MIARVPSMALGRRRSGRIQEFHALLAQALPTFATRSG